MVEVPVRAHTRQRVRSRLPAVLALWAASVLAAGWVVSATELGPVVHRFNWYHGVHLGDAVLVALVIGLAALGTWLLLRPGVRRPADDELDPVEVELGRVPVVIVLWSVVTLASSWVTLDTEVGPILAEWNRHRALRVGDLVFTVVAIVVASGLTIALLRPRRGDRR